MKKWLVPILGMATIVLFWSTAVSTSWARIEALQTIEGYAMAVHEQLMLQYSQTGSFSQTIHKGYDDAWTWSGHRAITLPIVALIYGLHPSPVWLSIIMITAVTIGAVSAGGIGKHVLQNQWGWLLGIVIYLGCPATMALALQDYQDLIFALPALVFCAWMMTLKSWYWPLLGVCIGIMPREECVPMVIAVAATMIPLKQRWSPKWRTWIRNITIASIIAFCYASWAEANHPIDSGHDMPLENALKSLGHNQIFLEGWLYKTRFYALIWIPLGSLAFLSPIIAAPAIGVILLHMTVPEGHGVDRSWSGHCHHMAPAVAFAITGTTVGAARLLRFLLNRNAGHWLATIVSCVAMTWMIFWWQNWSEYYNLKISTWPQQPEWTHPAWKLARTLTPNDIPIVSKNTALVASHFSKSYTFDESLYQKEPRRGAAAGTHLIVSENRRDVLQWIGKIHGTNLLDEIDGFQLYEIESGTRDITVGNRPKFKKPPPYTGPYLKGQDIPGVPPHEQRIKVQPGSFPVIQF